MSEDTKLWQRSAQWLKFFLEEYGSSEEEVVKLCGKQTINQIRGEEMAYLLSVYQALKDGDTTVEEVMQPIRQEEGKKKIAAVAADSATKKEDKQWLSIT